MKHDYKTRWNHKQKEQILILRDKEDEDFSTICKKMRLTQRQARSLYACAKRKE